MNKSALLILAFAVCLASTAFAQRTERTNFGLSAQYRSRTVDLEMIQVGPSYPGLDENLLAMDIEQDYTMPVLAFELGFMEYIDLRFFVGMLDYEVDHSSNVEGLDHKIKTDSESIYGFGGTFLLPFHDNFNMGVMFEHFRGQFDSIEFSGAMPTLSFTIEDGPTIPIESMNLVDWTYHETTITPIISATYGKFMPYAGPRFTRITADLDFSYTIFGEEYNRAADYEVVEDWSLVFGLTAFFGENLAVNLEFETFNNESYMLGVTYTF